MTNQSHPQTIADPWQDKNERYWLIAIVLSISCIAFAVYDGKGFYAQYLNLCSEQPGRGECRPLNLVKAEQPPYVDITLDYGKGTWALELGSRQEESQANDLATQLRASGIEPRGIKISKKGKRQLYQIQVGRFVTRKSAAEAGTRLKEKGLIQDFRLVEYKAVR